MDLEQAFDGSTMQQEPKPSFEKKNTWSSNKNDWNKSKFSRTPFDKNNIEVVKLDTDKVNFKVNYLTFTLYISSKIEIVDNNTLAKISNIANILTSKGYLYRGLESKESPEGAIRENRESINKMFKEVDKLYGVGMYTFDKSKIKSFGIVKGLQSKYSDLKDIVKSFMARDLEVIIGEKHNRPISFGLFVLGDNVDMSGELDYRVTGSCSFPISICKLIGKPIYNISNDDEYNQFLEYIKSL